MAQNNETFSVKIVNIISETQDVKRFVLKDLADKSLPKFTGGSHINIAIKNDKTNNNAYSLISSPFNLEQYEIAVKKFNDSKGGSKWMHEELTIGDVLQISYPINYFELKEVKTKPQILIAGGIGITPFLAQIAELLTAQANFQLHYCSKTANETAFIERLTAQHIENKNIYYSDKQRLDLDYLLSNIDKQSHIYVCGPNRLIDDAITNAKKHGFSEQQIHFEYFDELAVSGDSFTIELSKSNITLNVPKDSSILHVIETQTNVKVDNACRNGFCGSCETKVLAGEIEHLDQFYDDDEKTQDKMLVCVSRAAKGKKIVLDL